LTCILIMLQADIFEQINNFTFTVLIIIVLVFDLGVSFGKV